MREARQRRDVAGIDTCVYDSGPAGERHTVVMLHGGDPRSLSNALDWDTVWDPAAIGARLVAYDKPGQGLTYDAALPAEAMTGPALSRHLEALVESLGTGPVVLMGHSRGALPVSDLALRRPELVAGLVLVASNTLAPSSPETPAEFYPRAYADPPSEPDEAYVRREPELNSFATDHLDQAFLDGRLAAARHGGWWWQRELRMAQYSSTILPSLNALRADVLAGVEEHGFAMPVLQVWGQDDVSAPVSLGAALFSTLARRTERCSAVVLNRARHYVYRDQAGEFLGQLRTFVQQLGAP